MKTTKKVFNTIELEISRALKDQQIYSDLRLMEEKRIVYLTGMKHGAVGMLLTIVFILFILALIGMVQ